MKKTQKTALLVASLVATILVTGCQMPTMKAKSTLTNTGDAVVERKTKNADDTTTAFWERKSAAAAELELKNNELEKSAAVKIARAKAKGKKQSGRFSDWFWTPARPYGGSYGNNGGNGAGTGNIVTGQWINGNIVYY